MSILRFGIWSKSQLAQRAHATPLETDVARSHEGAEVDHLGHDIGQLLLGRDEHDLSPAVSDEPAQVVLPAQEVRRFGGDAKFVAEIIRGRVVDE